MMNSIIGAIIITIVVFCGLALLIHFCSKSNYCISYQSKKRRFKIYPNKENLKSPHNQSNE